MMYIGYGGSKQGVLTPKGEKFLFWILDKVVILGKLLQHVNMQNSWIFLHF